MRSLLAHKFSFAVCGAQCVAICLRKGKKCSIFSRKHLTFEKKNWTTQFTV